MGKKDKIGTVYIYALCEPDTAEIKYIGKSINPKERYFNHISKNTGGNKNTLLCDWILNLRIINKLPSMIILQKIPEELPPIYIERIEQLHIKSALDSGALLLNKFYSKRLMSWEKKS